MLVLFIYAFHTELKCLQIILNDETKSKALEDDCREKLQQRAEMFNNAAKVSFCLRKIDLTSHKYQHFPNDR
jgi:hypothetical protein